MCMFMGKALYRLHVYSTYITCSTDLEVGLRVSRMPLELCSLCRARTTSRSAGEGGTVAGKAQGSKRAGTLQGGGRSSVCAHPGRLPVGLECEVDGGGADDRGLVLEHLILEPISSKYSKWVRQVLRRVTK